MPIPDDAPKGVRDTIHVAEDGRVRSIRVKVDVRHPWPADVRVTLVPPDGAGIVLHDRRSRERDIRTTFRTDTTPGLLRLTGTPVRGDWTLHVADLAPLDAGTFRSWELRIDVDEAPRTAVDAPGETIPDDDPAGVVRHLDVPGGAPLRDVAVTLDVTHPWLADLVVTLTPPGRGPIELGPLAAPGETLVRTWRSGEVAGLTALRGTNPAGRWTLKVADVLARDVGKLNRWSVAWWPA